ncbi:MAG: ATP-binding cassette domain-containing protein [Ekhidna sp.]|uniref:ABC transporter ATP-binding protein n=1 Tax=Ekhidna sp. TaxID=2608089 RepID=UPI0032EB284F
MKITGKHIGKKFRKNWIFRDLNFEFSSGETVAITGKNGAGKSTLIQIIAGYLTPSEGEILIDGKPIDDPSPQTTFVGPYTEIIEEFTLGEFLKFHSKFKTPACTIEEMAQSASLPLNKVIGEFSTGMKQRARLITAFFFENDLIFLDEPTSNLDAEGFDWWKSQLERFDKRLVFIASNDPGEINVCSKQLSL